MAKGKPKKTAARADQMSLKFRPGYKERLEKVAAATTISHHMLAQRAVEAVVESVESNGNEIVMPIRLAVRRIPTDNPELSRL